MSSHTLDNRDTAADAATVYTHITGGRNTMSEQDLLDAVTEAIAARCTCGCVHGDPMAPADPRALASSLISAVREMSCSSREGLPDVV
jgi:hypothetical protein